MSRVSIVTDSTAYLSPETIARYDIRVVPLKVIFGTESFAEGVDITNEEFYRRLAKSRVLPITSQPAVSDFINVYSELTQLGYDVLSIHLSGKLSGTVNSAKMMWRIILFSISSQCLSIIPHAVASVR